MIIFIYSDLGAHIDGFIAVVAHTLVIGASAVSRLKVHILCKIYDTVVSGVVLMRRKGINC